MVMVNTHEAKTRLSALIAAVLEGREEVTICRNGIPAVKLVRVEHHPEDHFRQDPSLKALCHEDPCAPLEPEDWPEAFG